VKNLAIARRYAKALLLIGKEDGKIDTYREELGAFANLVEQEKNLQQVLVNPLYDADGRKKVLTRVMDDLKLSQAMTTFLLFLFDKGRIGFLGVSTTFSRKFADELKGVARASLVSATELSSETIDKIRSVPVRKDG
jgi:F-type H+-transporting ATPase subunit delta